MDILMNYSLPPLMNLLDVKMSPHVRDAERHARKWLKSLGLEDTRYEVCQRDMYMAGLYAAYMWPNSSRNDLRILALLTAWFSCQDDLADETLGDDPEALEEVLSQVYEKACAGSVTSGSGLAGGLADVIGRAGAFMPDQWRRRTLDQYQTYIYPCMRAAVHRLERSQPGRDDYKCNWRSAGGFQVCVEFTYFAMRVNLPSTVYYSMIWQTVRRLTLNLLKAVNDLLSFKIMKNPDEDIYNLITHWRHQNDSSPDQAAAQLGRQIENWVRQFFRTRTRLPVELGRLGCEAVVIEQAVRCAEAFEWLWRGNAAWHMAVPRYREVRFQPD
ncbi:MULTISPECIES: terpene synthase family protein [unclassified Pseudomonas]|uniref:terpene synthase family protein n=1 Tax=unclassified Pseudomonas TaxID=196821 RepID=UPI00215B8CB8|nr:MULTISPECIES: hypothetical protein [unclassified Pseudomonas]MCR8931730.1 hypothetical protein [Pseudomonas sp. S11A4]MCR8975338.1 hypothetical protein [Pseudomonas sp. S11P7]